MGRDRQWSASRSSGRTALARMIRRRPLACLALVPVLWHAARHAQAQGKVDVTGQRRVALVIGNGRYPEFPLNNPEHDARLIAQTLRSLGFEVGEHLNLTARDFKRVLREFARRMDDDQVASVFYYAGHGVQIGGRNFLLPVDIALREQAYLGALKTPLGAQLTALALAGGVLATPVEMSAWAMVLLPLLGMAVAARLEAWMPNAAWLPRIALVLAIAGRLYPPLRPVAMGAMFAAIPAAVARGAGEMERPLISSMALTALIAGAALGAVLGY